ncbi:MAG: hypothetical protein ACK4ND_13330 [Cytophagaceae bacterium]
MKFSNKKSIVNFLKSYHASMEKAKNFMKSGDVNMYLGEIIEAEKIMNEVKILVANHQRKSI